MVPSLLKHDFCFIWVHACRSQMTHLLTWLPSWIFLVKAIQLSLPDFIGEHLMQQVGCSVVPGWPAQHICMSGVYSPIYSSSKWKWESFYLYVRPLTSEPIFINVETSVSWCLLLATLQRFGLSRCICKKHYFICVVFISNSFYGNQHKL